MDSLKLTPRSLRTGCGIYEVGDTEKCYVKVFATDQGRVMPVDRDITEYDLMEAYVWGRLEERESPTTTEKAEDPDAE